MIILDKVKRKLIKTAIKGVDDAKLLRLCDYTAEFICSHDGHCSFVEVDFINEFISSFYISSSKAEVIYAYATKSNNKYWKNIFKQDKFARHGVKYGL